MSALNEFVTAWWPVVVGIWTVISGIVTVYARSINKQLESVVVALKASNEKIEALESNLANYKTEVAKTYMPSSDIKDLVNDLKAFLIRIEDKVDGRKSS